MQTAHTPKLAGARTPKFFMKKGQNLHREKGNSSKIVLSFEPSS